MANFDHCYDIEDSLVGVPDQDKDGSTPAYSSENLRRNVINGT